MREKSDSSGKGGAGPGKNTNPSGKRGSDRMADCSKTMASNLSDEHMGKRRKLREDASNGNLEHINNVREKNGLPAKESTVPDSDESKALEDGEDELGLAKGELIVALRKYTRLDSGLPVGKPCREEEFVATHRQLRRERATYRELDKRLATYGEVYAERKGEYLKQDKRTVTGRKGTCPLRTIMVRLMPHEGTIVGERMSDRALARAIDRAATEFARATGAEIVTAAVHRMSNYDLHLHLQYTMVQLVPEPQKTFGRRFNKWEDLGKAMARAELKLEGLSLHPRRVGARRMKLIEDGKIEPEPIRATEWRKRKSHRSLEDKSILGYKFRNKINLVRAAEALGETELAKRVAVKKDEVGRFGELLRNSDDYLERRYLDLWFERVWRRSVHGQLTRDAREELQIKGVESARDYVVLDTTVVESTHLERTKATLKNLSADLEMQREELERTRHQLSLSQRESLSQLHARQQELEAVRKRLEDREKKLSRLELAVTKADEAISAERSKQESLERLFTEKERSLTNREKDLDEFRKSLENRSSTLDHREEILRNAIEPVELAEVAQKLGFIPEKGEPEDGFVLEVVRKEQPSVWQKLLITGQNFVFSIKRSTAKPINGTGALQLLRASNPKRSLAQAVAKLLEWFPHKNQAIKSAFLREISPDLMAAMENDWEKPRGTGAEKEEGRSVP